MNSCLYVGRVQHRRHAAAEHAFSYGVFMFYIDLAELPTLFNRFWLWSARRPALARFRREDYHGDARMPLDEAVRNLVASRTGSRPRGPIRLLTHLRYFGHNFNPVSFYYVFDESGVELETIVAEITNTPWKERHAYVLPVSEASAGKSLRWHFDKAFHVSPFMPMGQQYEWQFTAPQKWLHVHMTNHQDGKRVFDATLKLQRKSISSRSLAGALLQFPLMTLQVLAGIYWQALRLFMKGVAPVDHPDVSR
jgi:uncharacterized protein